MPEITLDAMCSGDGSGWWKLVEHFLVDLVVDPTDFARLHHPVWNAQMRLDKASDSLPLPKATRAYQEELIYGPRRTHPWRFPVTDVEPVPDRHIFILLFLIACTSHLEGMDFSSLNIRSTEGTKISELTKTALGHDPQKLADYKHVEKDTVRVCNGCQKPKEDIPDMVASGKGFSTCAKWCAGTQLVRPDTC